ncbi:DVU0259 family response regulator domain-containing protein [Desulfobaculum bizertense]|uniref:Response regulator receiver domain-containing protein n=1 Tax=Desulfobaculum bizertense DSM 18034 TaxID=1121442 RepID=A0A1T4VGE4_9BACT|nr:response regulator [Desulfobaculum bizertense]UIJ37777.1 response regulator [Desulfobaculum bizertense]SKA63986.1 Response regulator receiver domain-containing protein [Desulfobaculum bizertense DSM 18034]
MAKKILIIDDDPNIVSYMSDLFSDNGYDVCTAADGAEAYDVVENERPDLITLDLEMPEEWGPRFYRKLSQNPEFESIPVIVVSGLAGNRYAVQKAVASFTKPFDPEELLRAIRETIGE